MGKFTGVLLASDYDNTLLDTESARRSGGEDTPYHAENICFPSRFTVGCVL